MDVGSVLIGLLGGGSIASGVAWYIQARLQRKWRSEERREERTEEDMKQQLDLIQELTGPLEAKLVWLIDHPEHQDAGKAADEVADWIYRNHSRFPDDVHKEMLLLAHNAYWFVDEVLLQNPAARNVILPLVSRETNHAWAVVTEYKGTLEKALFV